MSETPRRFIQIAAFAFVTFGAVAIACIVDPARFLSGGWKGTIPILIGASYLIPRLCGRPVWFGFQYIDRNSPDWIRYSAEAVSWFLVLGGITMLVLGGTVRDVL